MSDKIKLTPLKEWNEIGLHKGLLVRVGGGMGHIYALHK